MATIKDILVPDIGGATDVEIIEIPIQVGDQLSVDDTLITLESDKASMDVPSPFAGTVKELKVKLGDKVSEGSLILTMETEAAEELAEQTPEAPAKPEKVDVCVPDIGTDDAVEIIEVAVKAGDELAIDDTLITLESDKASMDVPSTVAGKVLELKVKVGDKVKQGDVILQAEAIVAPAAKAQSSAPAPQASTPTQAAAPQRAEKSYTTGTVHAGPSVRRLANQLGADLTKVKGTGRKGRIVLEDVHNYVKSILQGGASVGGLNIAEAPDVDFSQFGDVKVEPLSRIKKLSGSYLHRNWVTVPHVTQFDEADITELEKFRKAEKENVAKQGAKLTPLVFIMKAVAAALKEFPQFNSSLDKSGENLIMKQYIHIGVAVDTPAGLVVPVIRDVDQKGIVELSLELGEISKKARDGKLKAKDMQGGSMSISSLGGIGGTAFTPIVNSPEVAILGVSRSSMKPVYQDGEFQPRLMLPLCLSYDHRVIDGADGARFITFLSAELTDIKKMLL